MAKKTKRKPRTLSRITLSQLKAAREAAIECTGALLGLALALRKTGELKPEPRRSSDITIMEALKDMLRPPMQRCVDANRAWRGSVAQKSIEELLAALPVAPDARPYRFIDDHAKTVHEGIGLVLESKIGDVQAMMMVEMKPAIMAEMLQKDAQQIIDGVPNYIELKALIDIEHSHAITAAGLRRR